MDFATIVEVAKQAGIAGVAVGAVVFLAIKLRQSHREEMADERKERREAHVAFMAFIESNNHQKTELVKESTAAIVEARKAIETHTVFLREYITNNQNNNNNNN